MSQKCLAHCFLFPRQAEARFLNWAQRWIECLDPQVGWEIYVGAAACVAVFALGAWEFVKRIVRCQRILLPVTMHGARHKCSPV